uniref:Immunoglobulin domain-containing protein n=1 Tax=Knipowitschia caucasica TaxID=637954 RepID=A0AAV2JZF8_KNICA
MRRAAASCSVLPLRDAQAHCSVLLSAAAAWCAGALQRPAQCSFIRVCPRAVVRSTGPVTSGCLRLVGPRHDRPLDKVHFTLKEMDVSLLTVLLGASAYICTAVHVSMREQRQYAMLFQPVVLPCQFQTSSTQTPVVQWWYKSFCRDRTQDSFSLPDTLAKTTSDLGPKSQLECSDRTRTSRIVASAQGPSVTLAEHYKGRDIAIINKADLRIGELQWGDSGVYFCKVIIADDVEGKNEAHLELLVLGRTGEQNDLLPEFDLEIMPEWAFVGSVVLGSVLLLLLLGICWCQCCPHSCCCYLSCCCCPDTCCCPRHLYEAGKMAKSAKSAPIPVYPYYIPGVPSVAPSAVPLVPSHLEPKLVSLPSVEANLAGVHSGYRLKATPHQDSMKVLYYIEKEMAEFPSARMASLQPSSLSELSSLHDGGNNDFRNTYQKVQMKALPPIADLDDQSISRVAAQSHRHKWDRANSDDMLDNRWNPRSEHMQRRTIGRRGRAGSLDELEEFARSYSTHCHRDRTYDRDYSPPRRPYRDEEEGWRGASPLPVPRKRSDTWDSDRPSRPCKSRGYDDAYLTSVLENKARGRGDRGAARADEDSDTPSKGSSRGKGSDSYYSRSPSNRPEEEDPLPPYSEWEAERYRRAGLNTERYRPIAPAGTESYRSCEPRPFSYTRPPAGTSHTLQGSREDRDRNRNLNCKC